MTADEKRITRVVDQAAELEEQIDEAEFNLRIKYLEIEGKKKQLERLTELYYQLIKERDEANQTKL